jgi:predicted acyltransferase
MGNASSGSTRIVSLDQFRGYTVLGMIFVNFVERFDVIAPIWKHHNTYCSYPDTIMPHFFFAVGFAYRLTFLRRLAAGDRWGAYTKVLRRNLGLILLGVVFYRLDGDAKVWSDVTGMTFWGFLTSAFQREPFQTLVHIGVTSLWVLPVIGAGSLARIGFAIASGALHFYLSQRFYYDWVMERPGIDGGPLGFLTWTIPLVAGTLAYDLVVRKSRAAAIAKCLIWGIVLMVVGYACACLNSVTPPNDLPISVSAAAAPPFVPPTLPVNIWTMSQRAGSISYLTFAAGLSLAVYALFILLCDAAGLQLGILRTFGSNALVAYIIHIMVMGAVKPYCPHDAPLWYALASFGLVVGICYIFLRHLEKNGLFLRL